MDDFFACRSCNYYVLEAKQHAPPARCSAAAPRCAQNATGRFLEIPDCGGIVERVFLVVTLAQQKEGAGHRTRRPARISIPPPMRRRDASAAFFLEESLGQAPYWLTFFEPISTPSGAVFWLRPPLMFPYRTGVSQLLTTPFCEAFVQRLIGLFSTDAVVYGGFPV